MPHRAAGLTEQIHGVLLSSLLSDSDPVIVVWLHMETLQNVSNTEYHYSPVCFL